MSDEPTDPSKVYFTEQSLKILKRYFDISDETWRAIIMADLAGWQRMLDE